MLTHESIVPGLNKRARNSEQLPPLLDRLECNSGSIIVIAIKQPEACNFTCCTAAWLSREERKTLKAAPERARNGRQLCAQEARHDPAKISEVKG